MSKIAGVPSRNNSEGQIRQHLDYVRMLPLEGTFRKDELDDRLPKRRLQTIGAIERVGEVEFEYQSNGHARTRTVYEWRVSDLARRVLETEREDRSRYSPCPCGHGGLENHGDYYTCQFELCDREFGRDELEVGE